MYKYILQKNKFFDRKGSMKEEFDKYDTPILAKWGPDVALGGYGSGWTAIPSALIRNIGKLGLNGTDFAVLSVVLSYWWDAEKPPAPKVGGIAYMLDVSTRTVERSLKKMVSLGLIKRNKGRYGGTIDLTPLVSRVNELAVDDLYHISKVRQLRQEERRKKIAEEFDDISEEFDDDVPH